MDNMDTGRKEGCSCLCGAVVSAPRRESFESKASPRTQRSGEDRQSLLTLCGPLSAAMPEAQVHLWTFHVHEHMSLMCLGRFALTFCHLQLRQS